MGGVAVVPFPQRRRLGAPDLARLASLVPTGRALLVAGAAVGAAGVLYLVARETPLFAVRSIEITGVRGAAAAHVRAALRPLEGKSLLALHGSDVEDRLAAARRVGFRGHVRDVSSTDGSLVFRLRSGLELRLGDEEDLALKLAVAGRILPLVRGATYLDVSLPARPVAGSQTLNQQVEVEGSQAHSR